MRKEQERLRKQQERLRTKQELRVMELEEENRKATHRSYFGRIGAPRGPVRPPRCLPRHFVTIKCRKSQGRDRADP